MKAPRLAADRHHTVNTNWLTANIKKPELCGALSVQGNSWSAPHHTPIPGMAARTETESGRVAVRDWGVFRGHGASVWRWKRETVAQ